MAQTSPPATAQPQQPDTQAQAPEPDDHGLLAALVLILGASVTASAAEALVAQALAPIGVGSQAAVAAYRLAMVTQLPKAQGAVGTAATSAATSWRAAYLLAAAKRLGRGLQAGNFRQALATERRYALAHRAAQARRLDSAKRVQQIADAHGPWLMWHARKDERTTPECRLADGKVWHVDTPPVIGLPGSGPHTNCRCWTGPGYPGVQTVDEALIAGGPLVHP